KFTHSYPHDWRGKTPVIFRATEQWFVAVDKPFVAAVDPERLPPKSLRERALNSIGFDMDNPQTDAQQALLDAYADAQHEAREEHENGELRPMTSDERAAFWKDLEPELRWIQLGNITFHPEWGRNRMRGMLESRPDWCLSRQ